MEAKLPENTAFVEKGRLELHSPTWIFIKSWVDNELMEARETNDYLRNSENKTAALRGRIKLLKEILDLPEREK